MFTLPFNFAFLKMQRDRHEDASPVRQEFKRNSALSGGALNWNTNQKVSVRLSNEQSVVYVELSFVSATVRCANVC